MSMVGCSYPDRRESPSGARCRSISAIARWHVHIPRVSKSRHLSVDRQSRKQSLPNRSHSPRPFGKPIFQPLTGCRLAVPIKFNSKGQVEGTLSACKQIRNGVSTVVLPSAFAEAAPSSPPGLSQVLSSRRSCDWSYFSKTHRIACGHRRYEASTERR
jgi:hypothetical protein